MGQVDLKEMLQVLDSEQIQQLKEILSEDKEPKEETKQPAAQKGRKTKKKTSGKQTQSQAPHQQIGRKNPRERKGRVKKQHGTREKPTRTEPFQINPDRPNLFLEKQRKLLGGGPTKEELEAKAFDEMVALKHTPTERNRAPGLIEVQCDDCGYWFDVSPTLVRVEGNDTVFKCNDCQTRRG